MQPGNLPKRSPKRPGRANFGVASGHSATNETGQTGLSADRRLTIQIPLRRLSDVRHGIFDVIGQQGQGLAGAV